MASSVDNFIHICQTKMSKFWDTDSGW